MSRGIDIAGDRQRPEVSLPDRPLYHFISDGELEMLAEMKPEPMQQIFWAAAGVFFGALQGAAESLSRIGAPGRTFGVGDLVPVLLLTGSLVAAVISAWFWRQRVARPDLRATIRARPRLPVGTMLDLDH